MSPAPSWDYIAKIVSIGDSGTGKSSLTIRLCESRFQTHHDVTIGVEFGSRIVPVGPSGKHMKLSLWDTAGQETYKSITRSYFRGASGALLVFDITRRATFDSATAWLADLRGIAEDGIVVVLVGNKSDLGAQREVRADEAEAWARAHGALAYVETSARSGEGVERAFGEVAERIYQGIEAGRYDLEDRRSGVKRAGVGRGGGAVRVGEAAAAGAKGAAGGCC
jgi:Ras-related protein Rab-2A